ncbi:MAG: fibronectin type III domain-containing protein, partial [Dehalococcoidales bacterium]|nr:fibronectin type III domain-containing protein [Dehalococcoidales bacterium]
MSKIFFVLLGILALLPGAALGYTASEFQVNSQSVYAVPQNTAKVLILDLTMPAVLKALTVENAGTAQQTDLSRMTILEDGDSPGWDGDEKEVAVRAGSPFWETRISGNFSKTRIFVTVDIASSAVSNRTMQPRISANAIEFASGGGPSDQPILGLARAISAVADSPSVPVAPIAVSAEALSSTSIRWRFTDLSNNEFGFKLLDGNLKELAKIETADLPYIDETGLQPGTVYSGRKIVAFNDRGESQSSALSIFPETKTLAEIKSTSVGEEVVTEEVPVVTTTEEEIEEIVQEKGLFETIQEKIIEIQRQINIL